MGSATAQSNLSRRKGSVLHHGVNGKRERIALGLGFQPPDYYGESNSGSCYR